MYGIGVTLRIHMLCSSQWILGIHLGSDVIGDEIVVLQIQGGKD